MQRLGYLKEISNIVKIITGVRQTVSLLLICSYLEKMDMEMFTVCRYAEPPDTNHIKQNE